jgi:hypothetical protein
MRIEDISEAIEVIALFRAGRLSPIKFRWRDKVYRVNRINGNWMVEEGAVRFHHFAVMCDGPDVYDLAYNSRSFNWKLEKVSLVG